MSDDVDEVLAGFGPRLRELRKRRGATLTALSEATGIPDSNSCCRWPGPTRCRSTNWSAPPPTSPRARIRSRSRAMA